MLALSEASIVAITIALISLVGIIITGVFSYLSAKASRAANRAVNNVPPGTPPITDRVDQIERKLDHVVHEKYEDRKLLLQILDHLTK